MYARQIPDRSNGVYWHLDGAATINGAPANSFAEGSLDANALSELTIQWDPKADSSYVLELRRDNGESQVEILAHLLARNPFSCVGHINYYGLVSSPNSSGTTADQTMCAPPMLTPYQAQGPLFAFAYETPSCISGFIWTIKYHTTSGEIYQEQWGNSSNDAYSYFSIPQQIPEYPYQTPQAVSWITPYNNTFPPGTRNALYGQPVLSIDVQCTGYRCGVFFTCTINDEMHIYYTGPLGAPGAIAVSGGAQPFCRNQPISLSTSGSVGATSSTSYVWSASTTGVAFSGNGSNVTANFANVPASVNNVTISVRASNTSSSCGTTTSSLASTTLTIAQALPSPQNMQLSNGHCPTVGANDFKQLSVNSVGNASSYEWQLTNNTANAVFANGTTTCPNCGSNESIRTPNSGQFTATVKAKVTDCGGITASQSQSFIINGSTPTRITDVDFPNGLCLGGQNFPLNLRNPELGVVYSVSVVNVRPNSASINFIQNPGGEPSGQIAVQSGTPTGFNISIFAVGACPPTTAVNFPLIHVPLGVGGYCYLGPDAQRSSLPQVTTPLFPNPTNGPVEVQSNGSVRYEWVKVTDMQGRLVLEQHAARNESISNFDLSKSPTGIYEVLLYDGKNLAQMRISKK